MTNKLGERIRKLRKEKKLTLVEIAAKTGIAQATLSRIETGTMMGTIESHMKIAEAIGTTLADLYQATDSREDSIAVQKKEESPKVFVHNQQTQVELLTSESSKKKITPLMITLQPGGQTTPETQELGVEKFFYILEGDIKVQVGKKDFPLKSGDSIYFDASLSHFILNEKKSLAKILAVVSPSKI